MRGTGMTHKKEAKAKECLTHHTGIIALAAEAVNLKQAAGLVVTNEAVRRILISEDIFIFR